MARVGRATGTSSAASSAHGTTAGLNNTVGNSTGTTTVVGTVCKFGQAAGSVGFYGTAGAARPAAYTQTFATASRTHADPTATAVDTTASGLAVFGFTQAQADSIPVAVNALIVDVANAKQVLNSVIDDLRANGLLQ